MGPRKTRFDSAGTVNVEGSAVSPQASQLLPVRDGGEAGVAGHTSREEEVTQESRQPGQERSPKRARVQVQEADSGSQEASQEAPAEASDAEAEEIPKGLRRVPAVYAPSREEIEEHEATHAQYRSWCPSCVRERGVADHHKVRGQGKEDAVPEIVFDCCFPSSETTVLVAKDVPSGAVRSTIVPVKGIGDHYTVREIVDTIDNKWGRNRIIMRTDTEGPIVALKRLVRR